MFMQPNPLKLKLQDRRTVYGVLSNITDPTIAEIIGFNSYDFYMIDDEHSTVSTSEVANIVRACEVAGIVPMARIRSNDSKLILKYIDAGIKGVMMPSVYTPEDVEKLVRAVKYPPLGNRGLGAVRAANYMINQHDQLRYVQWANQQTLVIPQIETVEAVQNLNELVKIKGVDGFVVGPKDLAMSMGFYDSAAHPEVTAVIHQIFSTVLKAGLVVGSVANTPEQARILESMGATFIFNSVVGLLTQSSKWFLGNRHGNK